MINISNKVRENRKSQKLELENQFFKIMEKYVEKILPLLKEEKYENIKNELLDTFYDYFSDIIKEGINFTKENYESFDEKKKITLNEDLFYHKDGKTLEDRLEDIFNQYPKKEDFRQRNYRCNIILVTESCYILNRVIQEKAKIDYVEIIGNDSDCDICGEYLDNEVHNIDNIELPPYHPNCLCEAIFYEVNDVSEGESL